MKITFYKLLALLGLLAAVGVGLLAWEYQRFLHSPVQSEAGPDTFVVAPGMSVRAIAARLHAQGLIHAPRYFEWHARLSGVADALHAGEYRLSPGITPAALLADMAAGRVMQYALTIVEGWTFRQLVDAMHASPYLEHTLPGLSSEAIMERLGKPGEHPEGRFFPDTYHFPRGTTDLAFLARAYRAMELQLEQAWAQRRPDLPLKSAYEALILASIIEKETGVSAERREVAGVFVRRLRLGMRLQTDPTVIYGLGEDFEGRLRRIHLRTDGPYNTYRRHGLPPTPIALPGLASIQAALDPAPGETLYFVSRGDGSHVFSETLEEHNRAVIEYQLNGRKRPFSSYSGAGQ